MKKATFEKTMAGLLSASAISLILATSPVSAQEMTDQGAMGEGQVSAQPTFSDLDTNGDGVLSKDEAMASFDQRFSQADQNGDGQLDQAEFAAFEIPEGTMMEPPMGAEPPAEGGDAMSPGTQ